jgi:hypothetical protein
MPPPNQLWQNELVKLCTPLAQNPWGYFLPEAAVVVGPENPQRRERHIRNWLKIRHVWFYALRSEQHRCTLPVRWWRAYLDYGPSESVVARQKDGKDHEKVMKKFNSIFNLADLRTDRPLLWLGAEVTVIDKLICRQVAWELCELAFRVELLVLDRAVFSYKPEEGRDLTLVKMERQQLLHAIFHDKFQIDCLDLPVEDIGLASKDWAVQAKYLEAFRRFMSFWPNFPQALASTQPLDSGLGEVSLRLMEQLVIRFYAETFIKQAGRPPVLPRRIPIFA